MSEPSKPAWWQKGMRRLKGGRIEWRFYVQTPAGAKQVSAHGRTVTQLKADRKRVERLYECAPKPTTLESMLDEYVQDCRAPENANLRKIADMASRFDRFIPDDLMKRNLGYLCANWSVIGDHFKKLSENRPNTYVVQKVFDELRHAFAFAVTNQWCNFNPILLLKRPKYTATGSRSPFTVEEVWDLLSRSEGQSRVMIAFLVMTGVRTWSEMSGLRIRDCNLLLKTVSLSTFVRRDEKGRPTEKTHVNGKAKGKTEKAVREIPLVDPLVRLLSDYIASAGLGSNDYLFPNSRGGLMRDNNWRRRVWKPLVESIGRPDAVPYELRHTTTSLLAELGVDAEMRAAICGHSEDVNKKVYTTLGLQAKRNAMDKLAELFSDLCSASQNTAKKGSGQVSGAA